MTHQQNVPHYSELFDSEGIEKVRELRERKVPNAFTYVVEKEDHTLGNLIQTQLLKNRNVSFAGYRMPHPLKHAIEVKIQTRDPSYPARSALSQSLDELLTMFDDLRKQFDEQTMSHARPMDLTDDRYDDDALMQDDTSRGMGMWEGD